MRLKDSSEVFSYSLLIRERQLDSLGHVHNLNYLEMFEEAWWEFVTANGGGYKLIEETKTAPVILDINVKFIREVRNREKVRITTRCYDYKMVLGKIEQIMYNEKNEETCKAQYSVALFDLVQRTLIVPPPAWTKAFGLGG